MIEYHMARSCKRLRRLWNVVVFAYSLLYLTQKMKDKELDLYSSIRKYANSGTRNGRPR